MEAMNGSIQALPRDGGGSRFVLALPVATADVEADGQADVQMDEAAAWTAGRSGSPAGEPRDPAATDPDGPAARGG
jgi:hypothetical protein